MNQISRLFMNRLNDRSNERSLIIQMFSQLLVHRLSGRPNLLLFINTHWSRSDSQPLSATFFVMMITRYFEIELSYTGCYDEKNSNFASLWYSLRELRRIKILRSMYEKCRHAAQGRRIRRWICNVNIRKHSQGLPASSYHGDNDNISDVVLVQVAVW